MTDQRPKGRPLDTALKERLHLRGDNPMSLRMVRGAIHVSDTVSRSLTGRPFIALKESEALLTQMRGLTGYALVQAILAYNGGTDIAGHGVHHVPDKGPVVIASTHPTGMFDFIAHAGALLKKRPDLKVVANLETEKFLGPDMIVPVVIDKQNRATSAHVTLRAMLQHLERGGALLIFGSGRVPDRQNGYLIEPDWRPGATQASAWAKVPIIPASPDVRNSQGYYRLRALARNISGGNDNFAAMVASLKYAADLLDKLGGRYELYYGAPLAPGTEPDVIKKTAEALAPGLYCPDDGPDDCPDGS